MSDPSNDQGSTEPTDNNSSRSSDSPAGKIDTQGMIVLVDPDTPGYDDSLSFNDIMDLLELEGVSGCLRGVTCDSAESIGPSSEIGAPGVGGKKPTTQQIG